MHGDRLHAGITMTTSPDFAEHRIDQTAWRPATLDNAETKGDGYDEFVDVKERITERRRHPPPRTLDGYLHELPAWILLDRLPTPMLATGLDGVLIYTNPAFATMLGHPGTTTLTGQPLPALLAGYSADPGARLCHRTARRRHRGHRLAPRRGLPGPHRGIRRATRSRHRPDTADQHHRHHRTDVDPSRRSTPRPCRPAQTR